MKPAIIFDLDGTAIDSPRTHQPSIAVLEALESAEPYFYLSAATGRVWSFAKPVLQALELTDPCIVAAGTQICDPMSGNILWQCDINPRDAQKAVDIFAAHGKRKLLFGDYTLETYLDDDGVSPVGLKLTEPVGFLNYTYVDEAEALQLVAELSKIPGIACMTSLALRPNVRDVHVTNRQATKEHAVVELCNMLKTDRTKSYGVGDGHNDLSLLQAVGTKVAMGNAVPEVKEIADLVIGPVDQDGFAQFVQELVVAKNTKK